MYFIRMGTKALHTFILLVIMINPKPSQNTHVK